MQVIISTRHGEIAEPTKEKITQKVEKLGRFDDRLQSIDVTVDLKKADEPIIEVRVVTPPKHEFVASCTSTDMFGALDSAVSKLEHQIKKHKEKNQEHGKSGD
ncbi:MAG: ribosome hibernation-promoting factor, HPF/YfiA family [Thermoguttaceae bacterium]